MAEPYYNKSFKKMSNITTQHFTKNLMKQQLSVNQQPNVKQQPNREAQEDHKQYARDARIRIHPCMAMFAAISTFVFFIAMTNVVVLGIAMVLLCLLECAFSMGRTVMKAGIFFVPTALFMAVMLAWVTKDMNSAWMIFLRLTAIWISTTPLLSVPAVAFVRSLQQAHAPRAFTLSLMIALRFTHVLFEQTATVMVSWKTIPSWKGRNIGMTRMSVPLMSRVVTISDCLSNALMLRCFSLDGRIPVSIVKPVQVTRKDVVFVTLLALILIGMKVCEMLL